MALTPVSLGGDPEMMGLNGIYNGQTQPELLGMRSLSGQSGPFFWGFDRRIRPTMVRIFFDPTVAGLTSGDQYDTIGLIQVGRITYQNVPISPQTYGMNLEHLSPYNYSNIFDNRDEHHWADMIDVGTLKGKVNEYGESRYPLFAFNGYHRNINYTLANFYGHPMPNGSLTSSPASSITNASLCASLYDAIDFDLDVPPAAVITAMVNSLQKKAGSLYQTQTYSHAQVSEQGPLKLAIDLLEITDLGTIADIQIAGPHMIIEMADIEAEGPIFVAFFDKNNETTDTSTLKIYLVDMDELEQLRFAMLTQTFENVKEQFSGRGIFMGSGVLGDGFPIDRPISTGKGNKGLGSFPFFFQKKVNPEIAFTYNTVAVGIRNGKIVACFNCLAWRVSRVFQEEELEFDALQIDQPKLDPDVSGRYDNYLKGKSKEDKRFMYPVINQYQKALRESVSSDNANPYFYENTSWINKT